MEILFLIASLAFFCTNVLCANKRTAPAAEPPIPLALKSIAPGPPVITEQPKSKLVEGRESIRLYCHATGNPKPQIRWLKDGLPLESATVRDIVSMPSGGLTFIRVRGKGEGATTGIYQCIASNRYGSVASQNASIEIASIDDDFRKEPIDAIAAGDQSVTIQCQGPRGIPEPEITWKKNGGPLTLGSRMEIRPGGNLYISHLRKSDTGLYSCVASNVAGVRTSTAAMLKVKEIPHIAVRPSSATLLVGSSKDVQCQATGDPHPRIKWTRRRGKMPRRFIQDGNVLRISNVAAEDEGTYICTAVNPVGKESVSFNITTEMKSEIVHLSDDVTSLVGSTCTLTCEVEGKPQPTIVWKDPKGLEMSEKNTHSNDHMQVSSNGDLIIDNLQFGDQGLYTCQATNPLHTATADIKITVTKKDTKYLPPIVSLAPSNVTLALSSNAVLDCMSTNSSIQWFKDGKPVGTGSSRFRVLQSGSLKINNVQKSDKGLYICSASNQHGIDEWKAWVDVKSGTNSGSINDNQLLPKATGKPALVNSTSDCLAITWIAPSDGDSPIIYYTLAYYRIGSAFSTWEKVAPIYTNVYQICDLQSASNYVFVVRGANEKGFGRASSVSDYMTTKTSSTIRNLDFISVNVTRATPLPSSASVRLQWITNGSCDTVDGFMVISQPVSATPSGLLTGQVSCSARTYELVNLVPNTKYEVRIRALKDQRAGVASPVQFITPQAGLVSSASPTLIVKKDSKNPKHVKLQWQPPPDLPATYVVGYVLRFRSRDRTIERAVNVNSTTHLVVKDLPGDVTYDATVTYKTQLGEGLTSDSQEVIIGASGSSSFVDQPVFIVAVAGGVLVVLIAVGVIIYCCCKRSRKLRKTSRFQVRSFSFSRYSDKTLSRLSSRNKNTRYNPVNYNDMFDIKAMPSGSAYSGATRAGPDLLRDGQRGEPSVSDVELTQLMQNQPGNFSKSNMMTHTSNNGQVHNQIVDSPVDDGNYPIPATGYTLGQYTNPDTTRTQHVTSPSVSMAPSASLQRQLLLRQLSQGSAYSGSNPSDVESRRQFYADPQIHLSPDLPPPPPTPPVSPPNSSLSQRSRTSSAKRSTGSRSSRSGQRNRRAARCNQPQAGYNFPEAREVIYDADGNPLFRTRSSNDGRDPSSIPPTPPVRGDSSNRILHSRLPCDSKTHYTTAEKRRIPVHYHESAHDTDQLGQLHARHLVSSYDPRNSANVSNLSMLNGYGSESDARESLHDHRSIVSTSSDVESFHMESVSQVGQNLDDVDDHAGSEKSRKRSLQRNADILPKRAYPSTYHHYPVETYISEPLVNPGGVLINSRKPTNKSRRTKQLDRTNSTSSCASSYHQNTGDSGMSAGVGCSTEHSSLNSHASAGSGNKTIPGVRTNAITMPPSIGELSLPRDGAKIMGSLQDNISPSVNQGDYRSAPSSAAHSRNQSPAKPMQPGSNRGQGRLPVSLHRPCNHTTDARWYPNSSFNNSNRIPLSPIQSPEQEADNAEENGFEIIGDIRRHHSSKMILSNTKDCSALPPAPQELSDVPEVSTSDFCEDYDDESQ